jgi:NADH-quinone oxidoreductase subunit H
MSLERITIEAAIKILLLIGGVMTAAAYLVLVERWVAAWVQMRKGPNRVGIPLTKIRLFGLGQPLADGLKFIFKEEYTPAHVDWRLYVLAPIVILATALAVFSVIPFGSVVPPAPQWIPDAVEWQEPIPLVVAPGIDVGIIFVFALTSLAVYGVILGGWASDNKYSLLGGLRSSAQLISYELSLGLGILGVVLATGSLRLDAMIDAQAARGWWNIFTQPLGFMVFMTAAFAEAARLPFDLPEAEQELIGGYHTEYSGIKLLLFLVGEFIHMITASVLIVILFLGGWHFWGMSPPGAAIGWGEAILRIVVLNVKVLAVILFFMLVRWTFPRFRFDQLMALGWKVMLPLGILNLLAVAILEEWYFSRPDRTQWIYVAIGWMVLVAGWSAVAWTAPRLSDNAPRPLEV